MQQIDVMPQGQRRPRCHHQQQGQQRKQYAAKTGKTKPHRITSPTIWRRRAPEAA
jgi:hypothetical protein